MCTGMRLTAHCWDGGAIRPDGVRDFNAEGLLVLDQDSQGRCTRARVVRYELEPLPKEPLRRSSLQKSKNCFDRDNPRILKSLWD